VFYLDVAYVCNYFSSVLHVFHAHVSNVSVVSYYVAIVLFGCFKSRSRYCACYSVSHLPQLSTAANGAPCMEGSGVAGAEGAGSRETWGSGAASPACVRSRRWR
jgi:hypothetical protein